ncbi:MAG: hypothetical protein O3B76_04700 [Proteobacteria bacterium]|nr:hypothetical protein [Pseudomonadota bacterium]MDA1023609.1 hypothetical protein [Pseudomonadota bacterium]
MLSELATSSLSRGPADAGLTAFRVAVAQAKVFEKTIEEVNKRQEQDNESLARDSEEQRQRVRENLAQARGGLDVVVGNDNAQSASSSQPAVEAASASASASKGQGVNIEV